MDAAASNVVDVRGEHIGVIRQREAISTLLVRHDQ